MKRNKLFILGICTVMVALVSLSLVSGTWAKYTSTVSGEDSAKVAKWAWEINDNNADDQGIDPITFDLFGTIKDTKDGNTETDVKEGMIAPGTKGEFKFVVKNLSEVNAVYSMHFTCAEEVAQIQYSTDGSTWKEDLDELNITDKAIAMEDGEETVTIYWQWVFEVDDATDISDTNIASGAAVTHTVSVEFTFTQVD